MAPAAQRNAATIVWFLAFAECAFAADIEVMTDVRSLAAWIALARDAWKRSNERQIS